MSLNRQAQRIDRCQVRRGLELRVIRWGTPGAEPPFLLIHGLASNARMWDGCGAAIAAAGRYAVAVDQRGHGRSDTPEDGYDFATIADDLAVLIERERLGRPLVVGQSWGGNVVIELALRHPSSVRAVAAIDGGVIELADKFPDWNDCERPLRPPALAGMQATRLEAMIRSAHPGWPESGIQGSLANFEVLADGAIRPWLSLDRHMQILRALWDHHPSQRYHALTVPLLLVPAANPDASWTLDKRRAIDAIAAIVHSPTRVEWFDPADHDLHAQFPDRLARLLMEWCTQGPAQ